MALTIAKFQEMGTRHLEEVQRKIADAQGKLEGELALEQCTDATLKRCRQYTRSKLRRALQRQEVLLGILGTIVEVSSPKDQIDTYGGIVKWQEEFRGFEAVPDEDKRTLWSLMRGSRFVRFQQAFTYHKDRIVPRYERSGRYISFPGKNDIKNLPLTACIVAPDRISDEVATSLKLAEFAEGDKPFDRLKKKHAGIPRLKHIFETAAQLGERNERLLVVRDSDPEVNGKVLYIREKPALPSDKEVRVYDDAYAAYRKTEHQRTGYEGEVDQLIDLEVTVRALNQKINSRWKRETPQEEKDVLAQEALETLSVCQEQLARVINPNKVQARDLLEQAKSIRIQKGEKQVQRISPALSQMVAVINRLQKRFTEMRGKIQANEEDHLIIHRTIAEGETILRNLAATLEDPRGILSTQRLRNLALFSQAKLTDAQVQSQVQGFLMRLDSDVQLPEVRRLQVQPFYAAARNFFTHFAELGIALRSRNLEGTVNTVRDMAADLATFFEQVEGWKKIG